MLFNLNIAFWNDERASLEHTMALFNSCPTVWNTWALKVHAYFQIMEKHHKNLIWLRLCLWKGFTVLEGCVNQCRMLLFFLGFWLLSFYVKWHENAGCTDAWEIKLQHKLLWLDITTTNHTTSHIISQIIKIIIIKMLQKTPTPQTRLIGWVQRIRLSEVDPSR